ncbi:MAG: phosphatidate cytidylyltransferase, partial [Muribaculaceae bacterium]|nr:phosphatidate cytidylyltransferase [Muribaculaceae bacterium]
ITLAISGAIEVARIVGSLLCHEELVFTAVFSLITALGVYEFLHVANPEGSSMLSKLVDVFGGVVLFCCLPLAVTGYSVPALLPFVVYVMVRLIMQLYCARYDAVRSISLSFMSLTYIALPLSLTALLYLIFGPYSVLTLFILLWLNDTGAYCVGCTIGKHRLFERISPKKSWEGFFGGFFVCIAFGVAMGLWAGEPMSLGLNVWEWVVYAAAVSIFGTWGDLCESLFKRTIGIKDSGHIIPGHGGILDRIDSLLLAAPATLIILYCLSLLKYV